MTHVPAPLEFVRLRRAALALGVRLFAAASGGLLGRSRHARPRHLAAVDVAIAAGPVEIVPIRHSRGSRARVATEAAR